MAERIPTRLTAREGRRFGFTVGFALLALAGVSSLRDHRTAMMILGGAGSALLASGLVIPTRLGAVERAWMRLAHLLSRITTPLVMAVMYFTALTPVGLLRRGVAPSPLIHRDTDGSFWKRRPVERRRTGSMERQF